MGNLAAPPTEFVDHHGELTRVSRQWLLSLTGRMDVSANGLQPPTVLTGQTGAIALTPFIPTADSGLYRISVYARVTVAASVNSSIAPTITCTDGAVVCTQTGVALTSNATNAPTGWTFLIRADASTPISYSVAYVSNAAGMTYSLTIKAEIL